jgi:hypothetical protein
MALKKGVTGNANGRPSGRTPATLLRKSIADDMPEIITTLISLAKKGDVAAAKLLMDRVCPSLKPQAMAINLPVKETLPEQGNEIIKATMGGEIPPDIGSQLITALSNQGKLVDFQEMVERLARIEKQLESRE